MKNPKHGCRCFNCEHAGKILLKGDEQKYILEVIKRAVINRKSMNQIMNEVLFGYLFSAMLLVGMVSLTALICLVVK